MCWTDDIKRLFERMAARTGTTTTAAARKKPVREISPQEFMISRRNGQPFLLLDCREPSEWRHARIPGAVHIPMNQIPTRLGELDPERPVIVYCAHGRRSYAVASFLADRGYDVASLKGGITRWRAEGGEVEVD